MKGQTLPLLISDTQFYRRFAPDGFVLNEKSPPAEKSPNSHRYSKPKTSDLKGISKKEFFRAKQQIRDLKNQGRVEIDRYFGLGGKDPENLTLDNIPPELESKLIKLRNRINRVRKRIRMKYRKELFV